MGGFWKFIGDKAFAIMICAPLGAAMTMLYSRLLGHVSPESLLIGILVFVSAASTVAFAKYLKTIPSAPFDPWIDTRRLFIRLARKARWTFTEKGMDLVVKEADRAIHSSLGPSEAAQFGLKCHSYSSGGEVASYLMGLSARGDMMGHKPLP